VASRQACRRSPSKCDHRFCVDCYRQNLAQKIKDEEERHSCMESHTISTTPI
jgi:hypothetical protein